MTDDKIKALHDDIAFMRALAQEGSSTPLLFGGVMVAAGVIFGAAAIGHWLIASGLLAVSGWAYLINWSVAGAVFAVVLTVLLKRSASRPGARAGVNQATGAAWSGVGFAIFTIWLGLMAIGFATGAWQVMNSLPVVIFALYGAAWFMAGVLSGQGWIKLVAFGCFAGAVAMGALTGGAHLMLAYAAALILLVIVPGLILMRREPSDIV